MGEKGWKIGQGILPHLHGPGDSAGALKRNWASPCVVKCWRGISQQIQPVRPNRVCRMAGRGGPLCKPSRTSAGADEPSMLTTLRGYMEEPQLSSALARDYKQCIYADRRDQHPGKWIGCASAPIVLSQKESQVLQGHRPFFWQPPIW